MQHTRTCRRFPTRWLMMVTLLTLMGCATTDIPISTDVVNEKPSFKSPSTIAELEAFIEKSIAIVESKKTSFGDISRSAKVGTFVGTLGLGAAGIAGLHPDAAIGFATLAGTSYQLGSMSATELSRQFCREAVAAMYCVHGVAAPLRGGYDLLDSVLGKRHGASPAAGLVKEARALEPDLKNSSAHLSKLQESIVKLEAALLKAGPVQIQQQSTARALHLTTVGILQALEKSLDGLQPGIGAYQVSASAIVSQVRAQVPAPADVKTGAVPAATAPLQSLMVTKDESAEDKQRRETAERKSVALTELMNLSTDNLNKAFDMLRNSADAAQQSGACQGKLIAAVPALAADSSGPVVLRKDTGEVAVNVSGGTGHYFSSWQGAVPPSDVLRMSQVARPNGSSFSFTQLKEVANETSYKLLVVDTAASPQKLTIEVKVSPQPKQE